MPRQGCGIRRRAEERVGGDKWLLPANDRGLGVHGIDPRDEIENRLAEEAKLAVVGNGGGKDQIFGGEGRSVVPACRGSNLPRRFHPPIGKELPESVLDARDRFGEARMQNLMMIAGDQSGVEQALDRVHAGHRAGRTPRVDRITQSRRVREDRGDDALWSGNGLGLDVAAIGARSRAGAAGGQHQARGEAQCRQRRGRHSPLPVHFTSHSCTFQPCVASWVRGVTP